MEIEEKLNTYLKYRAKFPKDKNPEWQDCANAIGDDLRAVIDKVERDKYVSKVTLEDGNTFWIVTVEGKLFLNKGGYVGEKDYEYRKSINLFWVNFALIFGGVAAGVYYTFELLKWFYRWSHDVTF